MGDLKKKPAQPHVRRKKPITNIIHSSVVTNIRPDLTAARRPFNGFAREQAVYAQTKSELLAQAEGQYVVLVGDELIGPFETFGDALRIGYERFGLGPLFVKQVLAEEPVAEMSRDL